jgi:hypothetical protein
VLGRCRSWPISSYCPNIRLKKVRGKARKFSARMNVNPAEFLCRGAATPANFSESLDASSGNDDSRNTE